ncbi:DUF1059 domain-containing protein [Motilibacter aurantiacus]|nr:DUF1059 domain-containing protein [Motilibacter aurantiacus]NHC46260.1 DUF1059 domain-containing protein [Motilibacter aurantiacus]
MRRFACGDVVPRCAGHGLVQARAELVSQARRAVVAV